jgi:7-carboxy-7-deazaguanine synthase
MARLRVVEIYESLQGEGPRTGLPTIFLRFAGCNMRCPGWPCDTQHAIDPEIFRQQGRSWITDPKDLLEDIKSRDYSARTICITGGEPFIQPAGLLQEFCELACEADYTLECFTNGSFIFPTWAFHRMTFMMDWKLIGSGEHQTGIDNRLLNAKRLRRQDGLKFVVTSEDDLQEAAGITSALTSTNFEGQIWVAPAWDRIHPQYITNFILSEKLPWRLNLQVHKYIWEPNEMGV